MNSENSSFLGLSKTAIVMCACLAFLFVLTWMIGLILIFFVYPFEGVLPFTVGLLTGVLLSMAKVVLLEKALMKALDMGDASAKNYANLQAMLRYVGTAAVLVCAIFFTEIFGLIGIICGVLSLQVSAYLTTLVLKRNPSLVDEPTAAAVLAAEELKAAAGEISVEVVAVAVADADGVEPRSFWEEEIDGSDPE